MNSAQARQWMQTRMAQLETLRDEVRVELHLASMEARERWRKLEPLVEDAERLMDDVSDISRHALDDVLAKVRGFHDSLAVRRGHPDH